MQYLFGPYYYMDGWGLKKYSYTASLIFAVKGRITVTVELE